MSSGATLRRIERRLAAPLAVAGSGAVGFVGADLPIDVLLASRRPFGHLPWRPAEPTPWADRWLESSFPYWARSILEQWHGGAFDGLETVVFSRADDASQRLFYYVSELQRRGLLGGPAARIFDIAHVPRESSLARTVEAILDLGGALGVGTGLLPEGIERANRLRGTLAKLDRDRVRNGPLYEHLSRAALWGDPAQWVDEIVISGQGESGGRVLLAGSFPPDDRIHRAVEAAGASVVGEAHVHRLGRLGPDVPLSGEPPEVALARQLRCASVSPRAVLDRARWIVESAAAADAAAVILWLTREDEALAWHVPSQRKALSAAGIPTLALPAARWQADDDTLDRVTRFCRTDMHATT